MTNNNDLTTTVVAPGGITLPDVLTESDLFMNLDASMLLPPSLNLEPDGKQPGAPMDFGSQLLPADSSFRRSASQEPARLEDHTLVDLDLGEDERPLGHDVSMEVGRDAPAPRPVEEDLFSDAGKFNDVDLPLDLGEDDAPLDKMDLDQDVEAPVDTGNDLMPQEDTVELGRGGDEGEAPEPNEPEMPATPEDEEESRFRRASESPLSEVASENFRQLEEDLQQEDDTVVQQQTHRAKRRKVMGLDDIIMIHNHQIKEQQADRSKILKPTSFLPGDPVLLTLMDMQKNGDFVNSVLGEGRGRGLAPELRGLLSLDSVKKSGELKRKRDSGVADVDTETANVPELELDVGEEEEQQQQQQHVSPVDEGANADTTMNQQSEVELPGDQDEPALLAGDDEGLDQPLENGDGIGIGADADAGVGAEAAAAAEAEEPAQDAADNGPVSLGTKHAVHVLREQLGSSDSAAAEPAKTSVTFQDILPEKKSSRTDATKMFFEVLALATKDAVSVEQSADTIGGPLTIRGRRGLWGSWAEESGEEGGSQVVA